VKKRKWYVGIAKTGSRVAFGTKAEPTPQTHGSTYAAVIGPFITKRGARYMAQHGRNNPHLRSVRDAERIAKQVNFK